MFEAAAGSRKADSAVGSPAAEFFCFLLTHLLRVARLFSPRYVAVVTNVAILHALIQ